MTSMVNKIEKNIGDVPYLHIGGRTEGALLVDRLRYLPGCVREAVLLGVHRVSIVIKFEG